jgi:hypothetical protein
MEMPSKAASPRAKKALAQAVALSLSAGISLTANAAPALKQAAAIESNGRSKFSIAMDTAPTASDGKLTLLARISNSREVLDLSDLATVTATTIEVDLSLFPLAPDSYTVNVALESVDGRLTVLGTLNLNVAPRAANDAPAEAYAFEFKPTLDLGVKAQVLERTQNGGRTSARPRFNDLTAQGGIEASTSGVDWDAKARLQYAGSSVRTEALTYSNDGVRAAKLNVQDYLFDGGWRDTRVQLGAVSVTTHPVLLSNISNRGAAFAHRLPFGLEISGAAQAVTSLAGLDNFTGLSSQRAQSRSLNAGYDFIRANPGETRLDVSLFDGVKPNFGAAVGAAEEKSQGVGGRFLWRNATGDLRTEWIFAQSAHEVAKPEGGNKKERGQAYTAEAGYDALKGYDVWGNKLAITTAARFEYSSPFYRSLGSNFVSNYQTTSQLIGLALGSAQLQLQAIQRFDNVGADRAYIRNRINVRLINLNLPSDLVQSAYASWFKAKADSAAKTDSKPDAMPDASSAATAVTKKPSPWIPSISFSHNVYDGFGDKSFVPAGFVESDLPHVLSSNSAMGLAWKFEKVSAGWKGTLTREKNLQIGEEKTSTRNLRHSFSVDYNPTSELSFGAGYDRGVGERLDDPALKLAATVSSKASWRIDDKNDVALDVNRSRDYDSINSKNGISRRAQIQWTSKRDLTLPGLSKPLPMRSYVRGLVSDNYNWSIGATSVATPRVWAVQLGFTVSLF